MAITTKTMSLLVAAFGVLSFVFGVIAENKKSNNKVTVLSHIGFPGGIVLHVVKPASGTPITGKDVTICKYAADPTVALGFVSFGFLLAATVAGGLSLFYPYKGKSVPRPALFQSTSLFVFFIIALGTTGLAAAMLLWPTITEHNHLVSNVHHLGNECPTAKTGLLGGGAFLSLDSALFWLVCLMLADNAREDYLDDLKGEGGGAYDADEVLKGSA